MGPKVHHVHQRLSRDTAKVVQSGHDLGQKSLFLDIPTIRRKEYIYYNFTQPPPQAFGISSQVQRDPEKRNGVICLVLPWRFILNATDVLAVQNEKKRNLKQKGALAALKTFSSDVIENINVKEAIYHVGQGHHEWLKGALVDRSADGADGAQRYRLRE